MSIFDRWGFDSRYLYILGSYTPLKNCGTVRNEALGSFTLWIKNYILSQSRRNVKCSIDKSKIIEQCKMNSGSRITDALCCNPLVNHTLFLNQLFLYTICWPVTIVMKAVHENRLNLTIYYLSIGQCCPLKTALKIHMIINYKVFLFPGRRINY